MAFRKDTKIKSNFSKITIGLASPEEILENSFGEVCFPCFNFFCSQLLIFCQFTHYQLKLISYYPGSHLLQRYPYF